ncbi:MAG: hypothetical protein PGN34_08460 [Methylobacterium frigidaeris]
MSARDQMKALIRAEIDRQHPVEGARRTLELLVESSTRPIGEAPGYRVVDRDGKPRSRGEAGRTQPVTLADLVGELRRQHPGMFRVVSPSPAAPSPPQPSPPLPAPAPAPAAPAVAEGSRSRPPVDGPPPVPPAVAPAPAMPPRVDPGPGLKPGLARPRRVGPRRPGRRSLAAAGILVLLGAGYLATRPSSEKAPAPTRTAAAPEPAPRRDPPATGAVAPEAPQPPAKPAAPRALAGVAEVIDTATLRLGGEVVHLFGVEWVKGSQPQDLTGYLAGRPVTCQPVPGGESHQCAVDGHDLSEVVLYNGGGRATSGATPDLIEAERRARAEKVGIWRK